MYTDQVTEMLKALTIRTTARGYPYLVYIICMILEEKIMTLSSLKKLYARSAKKFKIKAVKVESDVRNLVQSEWDDEKAVIFSEIVGCPIIKRMSTKEFIFTVADYLAIRNIGKNIGSEEE